MFSDDRLTPPEPDDLLILETRTERKERSREVVRLAPEYEGRLRSTGPDLKREARVSLTFWGVFIDRRRGTGKPPTGRLSKLRGWDSNPQPTG
jgi:hypothetical protein